MPSNGICRGFAFKYGKFLLPPRFLTALSVPKVPTREQLRLYNAEKEVIEKIAKQGPCVIIGRCAASMIPKENRLSVFIYSDKESTVKRVMKRNQISEKEAVHRIKHMNRMRKHFYEFYSETEWGQSESYDMMLSSSKLGIDGCVDVIIDGLRGMGEMENE